ncbi:MAG TPA: LytTR family transcriptional regulator DNA-binding domain-containing protein [Bacteroidia bacterium]|nr:LytTR family transcriptional regulator DNA-binding domain-containing protein [Bacteroidia bacterium]
MKKLRVPIPTGYRFIPVANIVYIECINKITTIYLSGASKERIVSIKSLLFFETVLKPFGFGRMNKNQVVNHACIIFQDKHKIPNLKLEGYEEVKIPMSLDYKQKHGGFYIG